MNWIFFLNSIMLGVGLAMDAFSVSLANGLNEPAMARGKQHKIAGTFGFFQALMPMTGWVCVHTMVKYFSAFGKFVPWIALILLCFIGGKMIIEGVKGSEQEEVGSGTLLIQAVATSIDALSVGFTISEYDFPMALTASLIICLVTYIISLAGIKLGRCFGTKLAGKAGILGGVILIIIGIEIFLKGIL